MVELSERACGGAQRESCGRSSRARGEKGGKAAVSAEAGRHAVSDACGREPTAAG